MPIINKFGREKSLKVRVRLAREIRTTFASKYHKPISLEEVIQPVIIRYHGIQSTVRKYLINSHKEY